MTVLFFLPLPLPVSPRAVMTMDDLNYFSIFLAFFLATHTQTQAP